RAIDLTNPEKRRPADRSLGRVKIPTGAPEMRLSPDVAARVRERTLAQRIAVPSMSAPAVPPPHRATVATSSVSPQGRDSAEATDPVPAVIASAPATPDISAMPASAEAAGYGVASRVMSAFVGTMGQFLGLQQEMVTRSLGRRCGARDESSDDPAHETTR